MSTEQSRPPKPDGTIDWEEVFEDEESGLVALIARARTPEVLRKTITAVILGLFIRKDDTSNIKRFTAELNGIVGADVQPSDIGALRDRVTKLLRRIKENRKRVSARASEGRFAKGGERRLTVTRRKPFFTLWIWVAVLGAVTLCGIGVVVVWSKLYQDVPPYTQLVEEMESAALGEAPSLHVYGGALKVEAQGDDIVVTAEAVPLNACVNAAWILSRSGRVAVNGTMPPRLIPTQLTQLCGRGQKGTTITWFPVN